MEKIQKLIPLIRSYYGNSDPAHDWPHIGRVAASAKKMCEIEKANLEITLAAVYCHDLVNLPKNHPDRKNASTLAAEEAVPHLKEAGFESDEIERIKNAIIEHSFSKGLKPSSIEAAIVQDADRLDALGAIGILRCAAVNTKMESSFFEPQDPFAEDRPLDDKQYMVDHYFVKLFKLPELMNTEAGKRIALERVGFMTEFLDVLGKEIRA